MTAVWEQEDTLRAADRTPSGDWGEPITLVTGVRDLRSLDMAVSRDRASVVWASNHGRIRETHRVGNSSWSKPVRIGFGNSTKVVVGPRGTTTAAWLFVRASHSATSTGTTWRSTNAGPSPSPGV
jgi:hypothetical protein